MASLNRYPGYYMNKEKAREYLNEMMSENEIDEEVCLINSRIANPEPDVIVRESVGKAVELVSLITKNLLLHPFIVLRRQCQVHNHSRKYHIVSLTLIPVIVNLHKRQGLTTLWKGIGSTLLVRGMSMGMDDLISKVTPWPKEITCESSLKSFLEHILLKSLSLAIVTPFYLASLVETVQSEIASEKPGILDVFKEGAMRLFSWGGLSKGRMLPIWVLILPTITLGLARHLFSMMVEGGVFNILRIRDKHKRQQTGAVSKNFDKIVVQDIKLNASLIGMIASDIAFYPFETILHRLHLQGTRTIIDNLDTGRSVLPILTDYHGPVDCYDSCVANEGILGLYKGFGALILQYAAHIAIIRLTRFVLNEFRELLYKPEVKSVLPNQPPINPNSIMRPDSIYYYQNN